MSRLAEGSPRGMRLGVVVAVGASLLVLLTGCHTRPQRRIQCLDADRLLQEVLAADPRAPGLTLGNTLAQEQARQLLDGADDYF